MLKIRRPLGRLIFNMGIAIPGKTVFLIETAPWSASNHYDNVIMTAMASQITSLAIVYSTVYSGADQRKHRSSASLVFVRGIHRWQVNSPHKGPVTRKMFPFDDVIMHHMTWWRFIINCAVRNGIQWIIIWIWKCRMQYVIHSIRTSMC